MTRRLSARSAPTVSGFCPTRSISSGAYLRQGPWGVHGDVASADGHVVTVPAERGKQPVGEFARIHAVDVLLVREIGLLVAALGAVLLVAAVPSGSAA